MVKVLLVVMATALLVVFGLQNSEHVPVSFVVGSPTKVRLIFLLLIAATAGFLLSYVLGLNREIRLKKEIRKLLTVRGSTQRRPKAGLKKKGGAK